MTQARNTDPTKSRPEAEAEAIGERLSGKYMTCRLADEVYGIPILKVTQLIRLIKITRVPRVPSFVRGVINLRGKVIPVLDLRMKFDMDRVRETEHTVIIVVQHQVEDQELLMGILVDEVLEVLPIAPDAIAATPNFGAVGIDTDFILGLGKTDEGVVFLLDIGRVLTTDERRDVVAMTPARSAQSASQVETDSPL